MLDEKMTIEKAERLLDIAPGAIRHCRETVELMKKEMLKELIPHLLDDEEEQERWKVNAAEQDAGRILDRIFEIASEHGVGYYLAGKKGE